MEWLTGGSYGVKLREDVRRYYGSFVHFDGRGEMIPNEHSYCEIDPSVKDKWGIPVLRFHWRRLEAESLQRPPGSTTAARPRPATAPTRTPSARRLTRHRKCRTSQGVHLTASLFP